MRVRSTVNHNGVPWGQELDVDPELPEIAVLLKAKILVPVDEANPRSEPPVEVEVEQQDEEPKDDVEPEQVEPDEGLEPIAVE